MAVLQCRIRKIRLPNLARDESSDDDSVNCSEISAVTPFVFHSALMYKEKDMGYGNGIVRGVLEATDI